MLSMAWALLNVLGCSLVYLTSRHQNWLDRPLGVNPWRYLGYSLSLFALFGFVTLFSLPAALLVWLSLQMVAYALLPFSSLIFSSSRD